MYTTTRKLSNIFVVLSLFLTANSYAQQTTTVTRVVDGDTLKSLCWGREESIRLIGIDTPESRETRRQKRCKEKRPGYKDDY